MSQRCCVEGCENTSERYPKKGTYFEGRFIRFPRDPEKWSLWNSITGSYTTARKFICSEHFTEDDWRPQDIVLNIPMAKRKLKPDAVPSLKLPVIVENTNAMTLTANKMEMEELLEEDDMSEFITYQPEDNDESSSSFVVANKIDKPLLKPSRQTSTAAKDEMDVETRKRLVAEALAEYDRLYPTASVTTKTKEQPQSYETPLDETEFAVKEYNFSVCETKKCGEITVNVDDQTFALNCSLCSGVFLDLQNFSKHVKSNHTQLLEKFSKNPLDVKQEESPDEIILPDTESNPLDSHHSTSSDSNMEVEDSPTKPMQSVYNYLSLDNQPVITTLIHLLKQNPVIWDRTHPLHSLYRIRKAAITELVAPLNKTFPEFNFTFKNVTSLVTRLRQMYVKELKRQEECLQRKTTFLPHLWCLDKLDFLEKNESSEQTSSQPYMDDLKQIAAKPPLQPLPELNEDEMQNFTMEIIQEYKKVPSLWKINHPKYLGKLEDYETLKTLLNTIQEKFSELMFIEETQLIEFLEQLHQWFSAVESLRLHCERFQELFQCNFSHVFIALVYLRGNIAPFQCEHCKNEFHVEDNYVQHIRTKEYQDGACSQVNSYKCQYCCRRFIAQDKLTQHLRLHNTECPYVCQNCGKTFRSYTTWFTHRRSHDKIKGFVCEICGRSYYLENKLRIHRKTHLGIKDCDMCGKKFANPIDLQRHLSEVHRMKLKYECSDCGKKLKRFKSLLEHSKNCGVTS